MAEKENIPLIFQGLVEEIEFNTLPSEWIDTRLNTFSKEISLFDYQQEAIKDAINFLHYYYVSLQEYNKTENELSNIERKKKLLNEARRFDGKLIDSLGITSKGNKALFNKLKEYYKVIDDNKIHFYNFVNRMSFWMATGSGKTIILVKLIELLDKLKRGQQIPDNDILVLTHREDLIEQIKQHVEEFNKLANRKIRLWELTKFDSVKKGTVLSFKEDINVFVYRSDLISDRTKEKLLSFEDIENNGNWYVLLDEAHKGDKEDSKRQIYYSVLTRNGFIFNFSATFTDAWDILTTIYNFNLDAFIRQGYGKNVYLSQQELNVFKQKDYFESKEKQKIVLKSLILLSIAKKARETINKKLQNPAYHNPLMVSLVNSVNVQDSDLEIFFKEIENIAKGDIDKEILEKAKQEIVQELEKHPRFVFGSESLILKKELIEKIDAKDILKWVFNASSFGKIEVLKIPSNREELIFKLKTSDQPFALIKIGDITTWLKEKLENYEINESFENRSFFKSISKDDNHVNILMGSRAFYEGWDSNRPNVMVFINIGTGDAKKYVTQSIGRGVRIEPIKGKRKRLIPLKKETNLAKEMCSKLDDYAVSLIETLFVFGTSKTNVSKILESIKYERKTAGEIIELEENIDAKQRELIIPTYKDRKEMVAVAELPKFEGNRQMLKDYLNWLGDEKIIYNQLSQAREIQPKHISEAKEFVENGSFIENGSRNVSIQMQKLVDHLNITLQDLDKFKKLEDEIIHFKKIRVSLENSELEKFKEAVEKVKMFVPSEKEEEKFKEKLEKKQISIEEYTKKIKELSKSSSEEEFKDLKIKNVANHYYVPLILSTREKIDYINHIISVESERRFIEKLEVYLKKENNFLAQFDWWMFSKLDEHTDEVYLPYYNKAHNKIEKFKPDFIFWLKKGNQYTILFTDPKGTSHTDYEYKVDGYKFLFEEKLKRKTFKFDKYAVDVCLFLYTEDKNKLSEGYKKYWFDSFEDISKSVSW